MFLFYFIQTLRVVFNGIEYRIDLFDSKLHLFDTSCKERMKSPFPMNLDWIINAWFHIEKKRLILSCYYIPIGKTQNHLELIFLDFKCLDANHLVEDWIIRLRPLLSGEF